MARSDPAHRDLPSTAYPPVEATAARRWPTARSASLQWTVPAVVGLAFLAGLVGVVYAAFREVESTLERSGGARAQNAARQVAAVLGPSAAQTLGLMNAAVPRVRQYLLTPGDSGALEAARAAASQAGPSPRRRLTVWNAAGERLFELPPKLEGDGSLASPEARPPAGVGPFQFAGGAPFADSTVPVPAAPGDGPPIGWISVRSVLSISPPDALSRLIGSDARILFGNLDGDTWTDLVRSVAAPPIDRVRDEFQRYEAGDGTRLGASSRLPGMPWVVWVEFPRALMVADAYSFLRRMSLAVLVVTLAAALLVRWLVTGVTAPLAAMTTAAEAMAGGDFSARVTTARADEIGRLGRAFDTMRGAVVRELDARTTAHDRLREREEQLRLYAQHSPVAVAMFDRDRRCLVASLRWVDDYDTGNDVVGRTFAEMVPDAPPHWADVHGRALGGAVERCDEESFRRGDGRTIWVRWEVRPWRDSAGLIGGFIVFSEDISARRLAEAALGASEGRYRTLFDYAPDGILIADRESHYLDANPSMCHMLGYSRDELIGMHAADIVVPEEVAHVAPALAVITAGRPYQRQWCFRRRDGSIFDADVFVTEMPDGRLLAMIRDITDQNRAHEAVRTAEERMRFALESADVGIWDMDCRTGAVRWSEILEMHYGVPRGTFPGTADAAIERVHADDRGRVRATMRRAMETGTEFQAEYRVVRPDGAVRWLTGAGQFHLGPDGAAVRGVGVVMDVTARQTLEAQFQQAQKMEAVGRLAGGVAHDFNNLLTAILGYCELVLHDLSPEDPIRLEVTEIHTAGLRAAELTKQLLAFSRRQIIEPATIDLNDVIRGVQSLLRRVIGEDVDIAISLAERPLLFTADRGQMEQVIVNLAVNARDAMPRGGRLTIETAHVDLDEHYAATHFRVTPGAYVALTMTDTGGGMSPEVQAHLFEPFFTTKEPGKGTGLGLATVHGVVTRGGGSVGVYSEVGKGTSFKVYFPRSSAASAATPPRVKALAPPGVGQTVLVVDDAESLRHLIRRSLERRGYRVLLAANAKEAAAQFAAHPGIEVLLTDVIMPGASGPELATELARQQPGLRVIYMSGYTEDAIVHHGVLMPGIAFLHKPFTAEALSQKIHEVLG